MFQGSYGVKFLAGVMYKQIYSNKRILKFNNGDINKIFCMLLPRREQIVRVVPDIFEKSSLL